MSRQGTIVMIDREQCTAAIETENRGYTVIELDPDWPVEIGDVVEWEDDDELGFQDYRNTRNQAIGGVFVQNHDVDEKSLRLQFGF
jgi:hypothetical protein